MLILVNVDDVSGETVPYVIEGLMERGACNAHVVQALTKKGRVEHLFFIDAPEDKIDLLGGFMAGELGTIGMRILENRHIRFDYRFRKVRLASLDHEHLAMEVRVKEILGETGKTLSLKAEHEDLKAALGLFGPHHTDAVLAGLKRLVEQTIQGGGTCSYAGIEAEVAGPEESEAAAED